MVTKGTVLFGGAGCALLLAVVPAAGGSRPVQDSATLEGSAAPIRSQTALEYKALGDRYAEEEQSVLAADAYRNALELDPNAFTLDERTQMAVRMSWEDMLEESADELRAVLATDPGHLEARVHLARVYSWADDLGAAIKEADRILDVFPSNADALLIKADSLEWQGRSQSAIPLYRRSIFRGDSFDARVGLAYALLASGDRAEASEHARSAFASIPAQEERLEDLIESIEATSAPRFSVGHTYYEDSDDNRVRRTTITSSFGLGNFDFDSSISRTRTEGPGEVRRTENVSIGMFTSLGEHLGVGAGVHGTRFEGEGSFGRPSARLEFRSRVLDGELGARFSREILVDTVDLVESRTGATRASVYGNLPVSRRVSISAEYGQRRLSDQNRAHEAGAGVRVDMAGVASAGYRMRYVDYERSSAAYFAPNTYVSHRVFVSAGQEWEHVYAYAEVYLGPQRFERNDFTTEELSVGGWLSVGFRPASFLTIELFGETGDMAAGSVSGFRYFSLGPRISLVF